ncbi:MAG: hypothetical protein U1F43_31135 [Myxococcota bacterium]
MTPDTKTTALPPTLAAFADGPPDLALAKALTLGRSDGLASCRRWSSASSARTSTRWARSRPTRM